MKKLILSIFGFLACQGLAQAISVPEEWNYIPTSSYTDVATIGNVMYASGTIQIVGITISSPQAGSSITIYRSTAATWTPDVSTQAFISTDYLNLNGGPQFVDLFDLKNTSYTLINKVGQAKIIIWQHCPRRKQLDPGVCPGLSWNGQ